MIKKRLKLLFVVLINIFIIINILINIISQIKLNKFQKMSYEDMINYTLENNEQAKISIAIIKEGKIEYEVYESDYGKTDNINYEYEIGSISKTFVGLMISKAVYENKIDVHDSINKYLDLEKDKYYPTIERLLTHTSGYKEFYPSVKTTINQINGENAFYDIDKEKILKLVRKTKLENKDYEFEYSNFGISVLGLVLEKVYKKDFITLMNEFIENDLKLENTEVAKLNGNLNNYMNWKQDDGYINVFLTYLLIKPEYQKNGIGKKLMSKFCEHYEGFGRRILTTELDKEEYYKKFGFGIEGIAMFNKDWRDDIDG